MTSQARCVYCGGLCSRGARACRYHRDLVKAEAIPDQYKRWNVDEELAEELNDVIEQQRSRYAYKTRQAPPAGSGPAAEAAGARCVQADPRSGAPAPSERQA